jgi:hypothetical protein
MSRTGSQLWNPANYLQLPLTDLPHTLKEVQFLSDYSADLDIFMQSKWLSWHDRYFKIHNAIKLLSGVIELIDLWRAISVP